MILFNEFIHLKLNEVLLYIDLSVFPLIIFSCIVLLLKDKLFTILVIKHNKIKN